MSSCTHRTIQGLSAWGNLSQPSNAFDGVDNGQVRMGRCGGLILVEAENVVVQSSIFYFFAYQSCCMETLGLGIHLTWQATRYHTNPEFTSHIDPLLQAPQVQARPAFTWSCVEGKFRNLVL